MSSKNDPILKAKEQALQQLERSGGADMAEAMRKSDASSEEEGYTYEAGSVYVVVERFEVIGVSTQDWPIVCFSKEEKAQEFCDTCNLMSTIIQDKSLGSKEKEEAKKTLSEIHPNPDDIKNKTLVEDDCEVSYMYEKVPLRKTSDTIAKVEVISKPGAAIRTEVIHLTKSAARGICSRSKKKIVLPGAQK